MLHLSLQYAFWLFLACYIYLSNMCALFSHLRPALFSSSSAIITVGLTNISGSTFELNWKGYSTLRWAPIVHGSHHSQGFLMGVVEQVCRHELSRSPSSCPFENYFHGARKSASSICHLSCFSFHSKGIFLTCTRSSTMAAGLPCKTWTLLLKETLHQ